MIRAPLPVNTLSNAAVNLLSRSRIRNLNWPARAPDPSAGYGPAGGPRPDGVRGRAQGVHAAGLDFHHEEHSLESGLPLLSVFVLPRTDDRQMTLSLGQTQSSNEEEGGAGNGQYVRSR
jgi:hypothetical protein